MASISQSDQMLVKDLVKEFEANTAGIKIFVGALTNLILETKPLFSIIHSLKSRVKDPTHLKDKLIRKLKAAHNAGTDFDITKDNLFSKINDLAGIRLIHLHTRQMEDIKERLAATLDEALFPIIEGPTAKTWDDETRGYFRQIGIDTEESNSLYTSVHYVIESNSRKKFTCEIQVRTLAEELWGEVSHTLNYPKPTKSIACKEQIAVLARATSSCSRLVDSLFLSHTEFKDKLSKRSPSQKPRTGRD